MATTPVSGAESTQVRPTSEAAFEAALSKAESGEVDSKFDDLLIEGAIRVGGQMIIMPRANDILGEAMSEE
ncbi:hypothetical protein ELG83_24325 (plasmid) [Rhizobium leguminosarum]|uniref:hypothetical protein n=1 Tax=Rhizobium TaxID=379 RepID=UPI00103261EF|nr:MULTISPECIES: hypothetical protein [Rhizobium]MBY5378371.1 hypothetical protein [Rhizobium leguminosarum]TBF35121.1 hypothetical protein ELG88_07765 [Rhizobium leguminosarum]TBF87979.1 hypothetical protein ELG83_24325 [Rhizobium leguminosarum]WSH48661.1 hypothetical protein U8P77_35725 [Rhizobium johnstonii]